MRRKNWILRGTAIVLGTLVPVLANAELGDVKFVSQCQSIGCCQPAGCCDQVPSCGCEPTSCCDTSCCSSGCCESGCCERNYYLLGNGEYHDGPLWSGWGFLGSSLLDVDGDSETGFSHGLNLGYRVSPAVGVFGGVGLNHIDGSTQTLATVGIQRFGNPNGHDALSRTTAWFFYDHFDNSASDTELGQFRYQLGYVFSDRFEAGAAFSIDVDDDNGAGAVTPLGSMGTMFPGQDYSGGYANYRTDFADIGLSLGHSDATDSVAGGASIGIPLTEDRSRKVVFNTHSSDDSFGASVGVAVGMGGRDTSRYTLAR